MEEKLKQQELSEIQLRKLIFQPEDKLDELFTIRLNKVKEIFNDLGYFYQIFIENPEERNKELQKKIKRLIKEKELLRMVVNQLKDELKVIKEDKNKCINCLKIVDYNLGGFDYGGTKKRLFSWCSKKCCSEFYNKLENVKSKQNDKV